MTRMEFAVRAAVLVFGAVAGIQVGGLIAESFGDAAGGFFGIGIALLLCHLCKPQLLLRELGILSVVVLLTLSGAAQAQDVPKQGLFDLTKPDVIIQTPLHGVRWFQFGTSYKTTEDEDIRFDLLEQICEVEAKQGDAVTLCTNATGGKFDQLDLSRLSRFVVADGACLTMTKHHDAKTYADGTSPKGPSILLGANPITISGTIRQRTWGPVDYGYPREDGALIGWTDGATGGDVTFQNATLDGSQDCDYVIYVWLNGPTFKVSVLDSTVKFARQGLALNGNNGVYEVLCKGSKFVGNAEGSHSWAKTSTTTIDAPLGNVVRGKGAWHIEDCESILTGRASNYGKQLDQSAKYGVVRLAAFTNFYDSTSKGNKIAFTAKNLRCTVVDAGNAKEVYDVDFRFGAPAPVWDNSELLKVARGGSGDQGEFRVYKPQ